MSVFLVLAYIPESPTVEDFEGPDPFDTSYADKVIKGPEVSKKGKKLVCIGSAVEVLTGRVESITPSVNAKRPRRGPKNLLLEENDDLLEEEGPSTVTESQPVLTLLDDSDDLPSGEPIDLSVSLHLVLQKEQEKNKELEEKEKGLDFSEFEDLKDTEDTLEEDEFAVLASESLHTTEHFKVIDSSDTVVADLDTADWAEFKGKKKYVLKTY